MVLWFNHGLNHGLNRFKPEGGLNLPTLVRSGGNAHGTIHPKYSTEMHQNTTFCAELNGEHAGEDFLPLRSIVLEIWNRETKKSWNFRKFDFDLSYLS